MPRYSHSSLYVFEHCPHYYHRYHVLKDVKDLRKDDSPKRQFGVELHKALQLKMTSGLDHHDQRYHHLVNYWSKKLQKLIDKIKSYASNTTVLFEHRLAVNSQWQSEDFFIANCHYSGILDMLIITNNIAWIIDFKSGDKRPERSQLDDAAMLVMLNYRHIKTVKAYYGWITHDSLTPKKGYRHTRDDIKRLVSRVERRIGHVDRCQRLEQWVKRPGNLCYQTCPVLDCIHNRKSDL